MARMRVNGAGIEFVADGAMPLLHALRDLANLTGTKMGCTTGQCGACTVMVDGAAARSCQLPIAELEGADVVTVEGLTGHAIIRALVAEDAVQCGFCTPGMVCALAALLAQSPRPSPEQLAALPNICSCGCGPRIIRSALRAGGSSPAQAAGESIAATR